MQMKFNTYIWFQVYLIIVICMQLYAFNYFKEVYVFKKLLIKSAIKVYIS